MTIAILNKNMYLSFQSDFCGKLIVQCFNNCQAQCQRFLVMPIGHSWRWPELQILSCKLSQLANFAGKVCVRLYVSLKPKDALQEGKT